MEYNEIEEGKSYRWRRSPATQAGRVVRSAFAGLSLRPRAALEQWRDCADNSVVTIVSKRFALTAETADGRFVYPFPRELEPLNAHRSGGG